MAAHKLKQAYVDLQFLENEVSGLEVNERRHRALCFIHSVQGIVRDVLDRNIGLKLADKPIDTMI